MHLGTALLPSQPEIVHNIVCCYISKMYVFAPMSRKLQTHRSGMFLVKGKKKQKQTNWGGGGGRQGEGTRTNPTSKLSHSPLLIQKEVINEVLFLFF